jgi:3-oxoacyl-[acyl-carrier protein] reductase
MESNAVLITGSSQGLGLELVQRYIAMGYHVYGCSRHKTTFVHERYSHFELDVADEVGVAAMFKMIAANKVRLDMVVNNAGVTQASLAILTKAVVAENIIRTNLMGSFLVSKEALKVMQRQRFGRIVNFSSINVPLGSVGSTLYNACKAGVDVMSKALTRECGSQDITINTLGLSLVSNTGMINALAPKAMEDKMASLVKRDMLSVDEILHALLFLQSPMARSISGQTIYFGGV